jgi:3-dehydroquinate synthase
MPENTPHQIDQVAVALGDNAYSVLIGQGLIANAAQYIAPVLKSPNSIIVADQTVWEHYGKSLQASLIAQGIKAPEILIEPGEKSKSYAGLEALLEALFALGIDRNTTIIALGGGISGDLAGFAASIALRGVPFIQIPTTLLSQIDSAVGGKTAINSPHGKNLVGSFYQPKLVLADMDSLKTLPKRQMQAGYGEMVKYGLIGNADFYSWCLKNAPSMLDADETSLRHGIATSCSMKAAIVVQDEKEKNKRALLNFGHTFAHALEAETGFSNRLLHGEAVAIGMVMACELSAALELISPETGQQLSAHFKSLGIMHHVKCIEQTWGAERLLAHMAHDKKALNGQLVFILLESIGHATINKQVPQQLVQQVLQSHIDQTI